MNIFECPVIRKLQVTMYDWMLQIKANYNTIFIIIKAEHCSALSNSAVTIRVSIVIVCLHAGWLITVVWFINRPAGWNLGEHLMDKWLAEMEM